MEWFVVKFVVVVKCVVKFVVNKKRGGGGKEDEKKLGHLILEQGGSSGFKKTAQFCTIYDLDKWQMYLFLL